MDASVIDAIKRWPNVPAVSGWLSLDERGHWRLHPGGTAAQGGPGEGIGNPRITAFIGRNYGDDGAGRWFFQNGPQRVYVRLDAAPYIIEVGGDGNSLQTHTGKAVRQVSSWWLDHEGRLYASTDAGPGMIAGRDLPQVLEQLHAVDGEAGLEAAASLAPGAVLEVLHPACPQGAPLRRETRAAIATALGYVLQA